jgi:hypothetical protein
MMVPRVGPGLSLVVMNIRKAGETRRPGRLVDPITEPATKREQGDRQTVSGSWERRDRFLMPIPWYRAFFENGVRIPCDL